MSITSYSELKTAIETRMKRDDDDFSAAVTDFITLAETRIYRDIRVKAMETAFTGTIASGVVALPSSYLGLKFARITTSTSPILLQRKDSEWIYANYPNRTAEGLPIAIAREGDNFIFGPYPDSTYSVAGVYYKRLTALSDSNTSNWLITDCPDLIFYAALCEAADYVEDDAAMARFNQKYQQVAAAVLHQDQAEELSGGPLSVTFR
jgi:hypothetical protein